MKVQFKTNKETILFERSICPNKEPLPQSNNKITTARYRALVRMVEFDYHTKNVIVWLECVYDFLKKSYIHD
jgi:hypothetical protein